MSRTVLRAAGAAVVAAAVLTPTGFRRQCSALQGGGEAGPYAERDKESPIAPGRSGVHRSQAGRFCCSMYCRRTLIGAPPTVPAK
jgi:hypothetical protein